MSLDPADAIAPKKRKALGDQNAEPKRLKTEPGPVTPAPAPAPIAVSVLPASMAAPAAAYVRERAGGIVAAVRTPPPGAAGAKFAALSQRYEDHPRLDRSRGGATVPKSKKKKIPDKAGETSAAAVAEEYEMEGVDVTYQGKWMETGRASQPAPMVGRRDLQLLSQLSQLLINAQHAAGKAEYRTRRETAKAAAAAKKKPSKSKGTADKAKTRVTVSKAKLTQEIEAMVLGDRILISANETWATDFLKAADLRKLLKARQSPNAKAAKDWTERKERKIADLAAALVLDPTVDPEAGLLSEAAKAGLARLVQLETDCEMVPEQRAAVATILTVLYNVASGAKKVVFGGSPAEAESFVRQDKYAGCIIIVAATMDNKGKKALLHAEQGLVLTALLADHNGASAVAGGKRPCTVCWLTLRLARRCDHDITFNWHPGGYWEGTTFRGLARVAQQLGYRKASDLEAQLLEICEADEGLVQYVTSLTQDPNHPGLLRELSDLPAAVKKFRTDALTQSSSLSEYPSPAGDLVDGDDDGSLAVWAADELDGEFSDEEDDSEGSTDDQGDAVFEQSDEDDADEFDIVDVDDEESEDGSDAAPTMSVFALELSILPDVRGGKPVPPEVILLRLGKETTFGSDRRADEELPDALDWCFAATPEDTGILVRVLNDQVSVRPSGSTKNLAIPSTGKVLPAGTEIHIEPYTLRVARAKSTG